MAKYIEDTKKNTDLHQQMPEQNRLSVCLSVCLSICLSVCLSQLCIIIVTLAMIPGRHHCETSPKVVRLNDQVIPLGSWPLFRRTCSYSVTDIINHLSSILPCVQRISIT